VPVDQATVDRLRAHDWGADPFEAVPTAHEPYRTRLVGGRCFFLDSGNRCRIHTELSYDAKPVACRAFPLAVLDVAGRMHARLSFWCPTVVSNVGRPLEHQARWIKETARHSDSRSVPAIEIIEDCEIHARDLERVHHALRRLLRETSAQIGDRLGAAAALIRRMAMAAEGGSPPVNVALESAASEAVPVLASEARRGGHGAGGRRALSLYLLQDRAGGRLSLLARLVSVLLYHTGVVGLRSRAVSARATWRQARRVGFHPSAESDELLTRYFLSKLDSRRYLAGDATLVAGVNLLVAAYGVINVLARIRAASEGRPSCDEEDVRRAVRAADLLVVEHLWQHRGRVHSRLSQLTLGSPGFAGDLLAYLDAQA